MTVDPLRRLPTGLRLGVAALLCVWPMGWMWSSDIRAGFTIYGSCNYVDYGWCTPDYYIPGSYSWTSVAQSPARVFLVFGAAGLMLCALRVRTDAMLQVAIWAVSSVALAAALAAGQGSRIVLVSTLAALLLAAPPVFAARRALAMRANAP